MDSLSGPFAPVLVCLPAHDRERGRRRRRRSSGIAQGAAAADSWHCTTWHVNCTSAKPTYTRYKYTLHQWKPPLTQHTYNQSTTQAKTRQGSRFSIRMVIGIFCSDTLFVQLNQYSQTLRRQCCLAKTSSNNQRYKVQLSERMVHCEADM